MQANVNHKSPELAAILSFLLNGLGQIYNGQIGRGLAILGIQVINGLLTFVFIGFITGPIVFIWSVYDAYQGAKKINAAAGEQLLEDTKQCPACAERVQKSAKVCRYCGHEFVSVDTPTAAT